MACAKAGTASFLGYPVTLLFITKALYNCFILISFPATNTRIASVYLASHSIALVGRVNNKPLALKSHMHNVENQYIIFLCTNYCYSINIGSDIGPPTVLYPYRYW